MLIYIITKSMYTVHLFKLTAGVTCCNTMPWSMDPIMAIATQTHTIDKISYMESYICMRIVFNARILYKLMYGHMDCLYHCYVYFKICSEIPAECFAYYVFKLHLLVHEIWLDYWYGSLFMLCMIQRKGTWKLIWKKLTHIYFSIQWHMHVSHYEQNYNHMYCNQVYEIIKESDDREYIYHQILLQVATGFTSLRDVQLISCNITCGI